MKAVVNAVVLVRLRARAASLPLEVATLHRPKRWKRLSALSVTQRRDCCGVRNVEITDVRMNRMSANSVKIGYGTLLKKTLTLMAVSDVVQ